MKSVLITGGTGFVGSHLAEFLLLRGEEQIEIYSTKRRRSDMGNVLNFKDKINWLEMDITDSYSVRNALQEANPKLIFHLAAQSFVPSSWKAPQETFTTNAIGTINLLEEAKNLDDPIILIAGSSEEYGLVKPDQIPIIEDCPLTPQSPYGVSKVAADLAGQQYWRSFGLKVIVTRAFNHTGPRRGEQFVVSSFAKQIAEIEKGTKLNEMMVGNLEARRDFTDVRDMVRAYWLAIQNCKPGEPYNICSEKAVAIADILNALLSLTEAEIKIKRDSKRMRPSDVPELKGDCSKFKKLTGWEPQIKFDQTLEDTLNFWRKKISA